MILQPMAAEGKDAVWSMGDDTPLAFLARTPRPVYAYFRQRFAQVTNPAIDPLREACVVSLHTRLGPWPHMLDKDCSSAGSFLSSPFLSLGQVQALRLGQYPHAAELHFAELSCVFPANVTLVQALDDLSNRAIELVRNGARLLLLTDRNASPDALPVPMAMATGCRSSGSCCRWAANPDRHCGRGRRLPRHPSRRGADRLWCGSRLSMAGA